ncbi:MAG: hypothetical protein VXY00_04705 [Candidatus Latescibacterota bacterium]|nr:hypothetical protein [Candidatus Latescibacterota bacterium]
MKYISLIVLIAFSVTSSYAAVGLEITPIRSLADDLEVVGADKWWLHQMVVKAEKVSNRPEMKASAADGYQAGVDSGEIGNDTRAVFWGLSALTPEARMAGPSHLLGIAGTRSKASEEVRSIAAQTEGQKYVYLSQNGDNVEKVKQERSNKGRVFMILVAGLAVWLLVDSAISAMGCAPC